MMKIIILRQFLSNLQANINKILNPLVANIARYSVYKNCGHKCFLSN